MQLKVQMVNKEKYLTKTKKIVTTQILSFSSTFGFERRWKKHLGILFKFLMKFALQSVRTFQWKMFGDGNGVKSKLCVKLHQYFPCDFASVCGV